MVMFTPDMDYCLRLFKNAKYLSFFGGDVENLNVKTTVINYVLLLCCTLMFALFSCLELETFCAKHLFSSAMKSMEIAPFHV